MPIENKGQFEDSQRIVRTNLGQIHSLEAEIAKLQSEARTRWACINELQAQQTEYLWKSVERPIA